MDVPGYAVVRGAGSGLGLACAKQFVAEGAAGVALLDMNLQAALSAKAEIEKATGNAQFKAVALQLNISNEAEVDAAITQVHETFGRIDDLVNCAGIVVIHERGSAYAETRYWRKVPAVNLDGTFFTSRAVAKVMLQQTLSRSTADQRPGIKGSIVNKSSIAGIVGVEQSTAYSSSKHAVVGLTKTKSEDHAKDGLRANAVCPGYIETPMTQNDPAVAKEVQNRLFHDADAAAQKSGRGGGRSTLSCGRQIVVHHGYCADGGWWIFTAIVIVLKA